MKTKYTINVIFTNGETKSFKEIESVTMMDQGMLFIQMPFDIKQEKLGRNLLNVEHRNTRFWFPFQTIKSIECLTFKRIEDPEELQKYQMFKDHGIDMTITDVSHTESPKVEDIEKLVDKKVKSKTKN